MCMCWPTNECTWMHTLRSDVAWTFSTCSSVVKLVEAADLYAQVHTTSFMYMITPRVRSVGNTFQRMLFVVKPLSSYLPVSLTPSLFPICTNLEIQTYLTLVNHKTAQRCFSENTQYLQFIFQFGMRGQGLFKHRLFLRHASHGRLRAESL